MRKFFACFIALLLTAAAFAQKDAIAPGYDIWHTAGEGQTFMDFADNPIPAGFFFEGSEAFTGRVNFVGVPLATQPVNALNGVDTIVERLDTAAFDDQGTAVSGLRIKALRMAASQPIDIDGTLWDLSVGLADVQPVTQIVYVLQDEASGHYYPDLVVNVRLTFTHQVNRKLTRTLERTIHFGDNTEVPFSLTAPDSPDAAKARDRLSGVLVDVDGDGIAESALHLDSRSFAAMMISALDYCELCHCTPAHGHTVYCP